MFPRACRALRNGINCARRPRPQDRRIRLGRTPMQLRITALVRGLSIAVMLKPIGRNGVIGAVKQTIPNLPNSHSIIPDKSNKHVLAASLGADGMNQFTFDAKTGTLTPNDPASMKVSEKNGPRHFRYS